MTEPKMLGWEEYPGCSSDGKEAQRQRCDDGVSTLTGGATAAGSGGPETGGAHSPPELQEEFEFARGDQVGLLASEPRGDKT